MDLVKMFGGNPRPVTQNTTGNAPKPQQAAEKAPASTAESVVLTEQAMQLQKAEGALEAATGIDMEKVAAVKAAIAEGQYHVDAERLADNIARFEAELDGLNG